MDEVLLDWFHSNHYYSQFRSSDNSTQGQCDNTLFSIVGPWKTCIVFFNFCASGCARFSISNVAVPGYFFFSVFPLSNKIGTNTQWKTGI